MPFFCTFLFLSFRILPQSASAVIFGPVGRVTFLLNKIFDCGYICCPYFWRCCAKMSTVWWSTELIRTTRKDGGVESKRSFFSRARCIASCAGVLHKHTRTHTMRRLRDPPSDREVKKKHFDAMFPLFFDVFLHLKLCFTLTSNISLMLLSFSSTF